MSSSSTLSLFEEPIPATAPTSIGGCDLWELDGTISEYAYLTHNFFRYYGKFPSLLAQKVIEEYAGQSQGARILDSYSGSGTTLVEAALAGHHAVGVDINPLGVLAANVKTTPLPCDLLRRELSQILLHCVAHREDEWSELVATMPRKDLDKWFDSSTIRDLALLRCAIFGMENSRVKDFFLLAFSAIIRRVSRAYDGEVRPHINPEKNARSVEETFARKCADMIGRLQEFEMALEATGCAGNAICCFGDNRKLLGKGQEEVDLSLDSFDLALIHPPYLNCFDYLPVYRLELLWLDSLFEQWSNANVNLSSQAHWDYKQLRAAETRSWPATPETIASYRKSNSETLEQLFFLLRSNGVCAVVIGDSTSKGELLPVHEWFIEMAVGVGFAHERTIYRTTHYGTGKYAYAHRSHYHGEASKRDAVLIFRKPKG